MNRQLFATLVIGLAVAGLLEAQTQQTTTAPAGEPLWSTSYFIHGNDNPVRLLPRQGGGWYIVGWSIWREGDSSKDWKRSWWVFELDAAGQQRRLFEFPEGGDRAQVWDAAWDGHEVVVLGGGLRSCVARVSTDGELISKTDLREGGGLPDAKVLAPLGDGSLIIAGSIHPRGKSDADAWLAEFAPTGQMLWSKQFDRGQDETARALTTLSDGGCILGVDSGKYGKFGQGPSALWLIRCDANGERKADTVIEEGRIRPPGPKHLVECFSGIAVSYTTTDFPCLRPGVRGPGCDALLLLLDLGLKRKWQKECDPSHLGSGLITTDAEGRLVVLSGLPPQLVVARLDAQAEISRRRAVVVENRFFPVDYEVQPDAVVVLGHVTRILAASGPAATVSHETCPVLVKMRP